MSDVSHTQKPKKSRRNLWIGIGALLALFVIIGVATGSKSSTTASSTAAVTTSPQPSVVVSPEQTAQSIAPLPATATTAAVAATSFSDGTYQVGTGDGEIPPGLYRSTGPDQNNLVEQCYYARLKMNDGSIDDIISNNLTSGPSTFTVKKTDGYIQITGCTFTKK